MFHNTLEPWNNMAHRSTRLRQACTVAKNASQWPSAAPPSLPPALRCHREQGFFQQLMSTSCIFPRVLSEMDGLWVLRKYFLAISFCSDFASWPDIKEKPKPESWENHFPRPLGLAHYDFLLWNEAALGALKHQGAPWLKEVWSIKFLSWSFGGCRRKREKASPKQ